MEEWVEDGQEMDKRDVWMEGWVYIYVCAVREGIGVGGRWVG